MSKRRDRQAEYKSIKRFLEFNKDPIKRLKSLKQGLEKSTAEEIKAFHIEHSSAIFYCVFSSFTVVEATIHERVLKGKGYSEVYLRDLSELVLPALQRVLVFLPELIHKRWQFNSICLILRKLLHPNNSIKLRQNGIKLLVLWVQALQDNAGDACMELFASAIPHFPPEKTPMGLPAPPTGHTPSSAMPSSSGLCERYGVYSNTSLSSQESGGSSGPLLSRAQSVGGNAARDIVQVGFISPLSPSSELSKESVTIELMEFLLKCLTTQLHSLHWEDPSQYVRGFAFLFFLFKLFYLAPLYKEFRTEAGLYTQSSPPEINMPKTPTQLDELDILHSVKEDPSQESDMTDQAPPPPSGSFHSKYKRKRSSPYRMSSVIKLEYDTSNPIYNKVRDLILKYILMWVLPSSGTQRGGVTGEGVSGSPAPSPLLPRRSMLIPSGVELMKEMWFTNRDNVSLLLEICRLGVETPLSQAPTLRKLLDLYNHWEQATQKPPFMRTPPVQSFGETTSPRDPAPSTPRPSKPTDSLTEPEAVQNRPSILSWEQLSCYEGFKPMAVQAGLQASLRMIIMHTCQVFLKRAENKEELNNQVGLCRKILRLYQDIALSWIMDHETWEYTLAVLLHLTVHLLRDEPPQNRDSTLGGTLAGPVVKTLLVYYLRASIVTKVSPQLWDNLLAVLSSLTHWKEVVKQWQFVMDSMTQVLAQTVYNLNLNDLPLNRLEQEDQSRTHRLRLQTTGAKDLSSLRMESFSSINVVQPTRPLRRDTREGIISHAHRVSKGGAPGPRKRLIKANTEEVPDSLPMEGHPGNFKRPSVPLTSTGTTVLPHLSSLLETKDGRTVDDGSAIRSPPFRSISAGGLLLTHIEPRRKTSTVDENQTLDSVPSPGAISLPVHFELEASKDDLPGLEVDVSAKIFPSHDDVRKGSLFVNPDVGTPSPDAILSKEQQFFPSSDTNVDDRNSKAKDGGSMSSKDSLSTESMEKQASRSKVSAPKKSMLSDIFRSHRPIESSGNKPKLHRDKRLHDNLVLVNDNLSDSELNPSKLKPSKSDSDNTSLHSDTESALSKSVIVNPSDSPDLGHLRTAVTMRKSSSEGNIHKILIHDSDVYPSSADSVKNNPTRHVMRRVLSGNPSSPDNKLTNQVRCDPFSSEIIPHSHEGILSSTAQSPTRPVSGYSKDSENVLTEPTDRTSTSLGDVTRGGVAIMTSPGSPTSPPRVSSPLKTQSGGIGWTPVVAAIVWQRMLKILGDINEIHSPDIHSEAMTCLQDIWKALVDICSNLGLSLNNQSTPPLPDFVPPLSILTSWVVKACSLPQGHFEGRVKAYHLLCQMTIRHWHTLPSQLHLSHFYRLMHSALQPSSDMLHVAVKHGCKIFSHSLPGSSILLEDAINASTTILSSTKNSVPRVEALFLLGSLLCLPDMYPSNPVIGAGGEGVELCEGGAVETLKLKEKIIDTLFRSARVEPARVSRSLALYQVGVLVFTELQADSPSPRLPEGMNILLASLQFSDRSVSMAAVDILSMLVEMAPQVHRLHPDLPSRILEALCYAIAVFMAEELQRAWVDKVVVTLILCLRDWLMALPTLKLVREGGLEESKVKSIFEVLQAAAGSRKQFATKQLFTITNPVNVQLDPIDTTNSRSPRGGQSGRGSKDPKQPVVRRSGEDVQLSSERLSVSSSAHLDEKDRIQIAARSVLTHLVNLLGHFPFACGTAQMSSVVSEFHDCPSLQHLDELSMEIFDSPRVQFFSFNDTAIITFVEIPTKLDGIPPSVQTANYQTRLIVRDVSGKYTWDSSVLYGPEVSPTQSEPPSLTKAESMDSLVEYLGLISHPPHVPDLLPTFTDPLEPPSWKTHTNSNRDVLEDLLVHVERTSPECLLYPGQVGLCEPVPVGGGVGVSGDREQLAEEHLVSLLDQQHRNEQLYIKDALTLPSMQAEKASAPQYFPNSLAFHHCRLFLSHLGMLSWEKRSHLDLLEKKNQLILELKHLDNIQAQSRQTYKVAVLYVAPGQEDKTSIFSNSSGSTEYEEFIAGLGWEVEMKTHAGYMGGLKREFCDSCTLPYYATSSEEVLFHVSTRLPLKIDQKVRHLGNDEVHIVWSEHWRDYRRTILKTQFADVLLVIYPQTNGLFRIQIDKKRKANVPQFGPLFDGALVNRTSLSALVRATAINGLRAQRSPLIGYRGRYEERLRNIQAITDKKLMSSFEQFSENVMHPLEMTSTQSTLNMPTLASLRASPKLHTSPISIPMKPHNHPHSQLHLPSLTHNSHKSTSSLSPHSTHSLTHSSSQLSGSYSPKGLMSSFLKLPVIDRMTGKSSPPLRRARASTNDDRMQTPPKNRGMRRNSSVPDLSELGKLETPLGSKSESSTPKGPNLSPVMKNDRPEARKKGTLTSSDVH